MFSQHGRDVHAYLSEFLLLLRDDVLGVQGEQPKRAATIFEVIDKLQRKISQ